MPAIPVTTPSIRPTFASFNMTDIDLSLIFTSFRARDLITSADACEPALPPHPIRSGMKKVSATTDSEGLLEALHNEAAGKVREEQYYQPDDPVLPVPNRFGSLICIIGRNRACHPLYVFRSLIIDYMKDVVSSDYSCQPVIGVNDRKGRKAILLEQPCRFLLVAVHMHLDYLPVHDLTDSKHGVGHY
ncbi:MAG: hypothetical protein MZV65_17030 [Chromatiales bacterium]|nr:hypothetical protein [Chromatiales bacterium]